MRIINALFDGLTKFHPVTLEPMAALATHFETNSEATRFTFYLRGHPHPRGIRFPNTDDLPEEFSRGHKAPLDGIPARWSDGALITAKDFVYSWRRVVDPKTGSADANYFYYIQNAEEIHKGKRDPEDLGVRAMDDLTFEVILRAPAVHFLALQAQRCFFAVPSHAVARALEWGRVVSGAFRLKEWRPYQRVVLVRNPRYYEAEVVQLEELVFLPVRHSLLVNLYKSGDAHVTDGNFMGPPFAGALRNRTDYWTTPALDRGDYAINVRAAPFDNVLMRYALNMATDKQAIVKALEAGQRPAIGCVPSMKGYEPVTSLPVDVDGISFDVLRYDPEGARSLMIKAGFPSRSGKRMTIDLTFEGSPGVTEILQQQWRTNLNIEVRLQRLEFVVWIRTSLDLTYRGVIEGGWTGKYTDPATFLDLFQNGSVQSGTGWSDAKFDALLTLADRSPNLAIRMQRLAECERFLLAAMPLIPLYFQTYSSLLKPYVRGWAYNALDEHHFKYVWIDRNWRPS
ncbi:MAG TPA: peptide ABC transporter substrate-binding protein [Xanthobacteraceae bacterium]|nr:peptide ABC transporter substrate-binding protein [Xanthobacteraceae bacterium]